MFRKLYIVGIVAAVVLLAGMTVDVASGNSDGAAAAGEEEEVLPYVFDRDRAGDGCQRTLKTMLRENKGDPEIFKLYCVNKRRSFRDCAVTCSDVLKFEGSSGTCRPDTDCNFYDTVFTEHTTGKDLQMKDLAKGKATLIAVVPLWMSQAQYFYELMEEVRTFYGDSQTEAFLLPMELDVDNPWEEAEFVIEPYHTQRVHLLNNTHPNRFGEHPLMKFLVTIRHVDGFKYFDVYTDRPVLFIMSPDGTMIERLVIPKYEDIQSVLTDKFGLHETKITYQQKKTSGEL